MKPAPMAQATKPARRAAGRSPAPTARPTRTVAAIDTPSGTMNEVLAIWMAIWCAATSCVPIQPIRKAAPANSPTSISSMPPIGRPTCSSSRKIVQSGRQKRLSTA